MPEATPMGLAYDHPAPVLDENALVDELASSGFLRAYVGWASDQTDAPRLFHVGSGLVAIATALGNRVWCHSWGTDIYPNLWLCLLAPSGFYRKSTSIRYSAKLLAEIDGGMMIPSDFSREKLVMHLGQRPDGLLVSSEFGELLSKLTRDYLVGCKEMLTGMFDGDDYERKTLKETASVHKPAIGILTASTEDWISNRVTAGDLRGGFLSRFLFLPAKTKGKARGITDGMGTTLRESLLLGLRARTKVTGEVSFTAVKPYLDGWIQEFEEEVNRAPDPRMMGFFSRAGLCILKLSMCFQASDSWPVSLTIGSEAAQKAVKLWEFLAGNIREVITEQITTTRAEQQIKMVTELIRGGGGTISYTTLLRQSRMLTRDVENILQTLVKSGVVEDVTQKTRGRPLRQYRLSSHTAVTSLTSHPNDGAKPQELVVAAGNYTNRREESQGQNAPAEHVYI